MRQSVSTESFFSEGLVAVKEVQERQKDTDVAMLTTTKLDFWGPSGIHTALCLVRGWQ